MTNVTVRAIDGVMDQLDPVRILVVEAITMLEDAIDPLIPAQAPGSTAGDIAVAVEHLRTTEANGRRLVRRIEAAIQITGQGG